MKRTTDSSRSATQRALTNTGRYICLPVLLLIAVDLVVPSEYSLVREWVSPANRTISYDSMSAQQADSDHVFFGLEDASSEALEGSAESTSLGSWAGSFDASAAGETDAACWSPMSVNLNLTNTGGEVTGSGSYWVDPADCSVHEDKFQVFVKVFGARRGGRLSLRLRDTGHGDVIMTFDGLIMPERVSGWFYSPDARPASGPVTLRPASSTG
jgi:hypothetical protein